MRSGHWLGPVLCVFFNAFRLMVQWQERHMSCEKTRLILKGSLLEQVEKNGEELDEFV